MSENTQMNYPSYSVFSNSIEDEIPSSQMPLHQQTQNDVFYESQIESPLEDEDKLETIFERYKYLGTELERNLKQMENKNSTLTTVLTQCTKECDFMEQQKELQEKTLVELQHKLEDLNIQKINIVEQNVQERDLKLELINGKFKTVVNNDTYIRETLSKINEILESDRKAFQNLVRTLENEVEKSKESGKSYINTMRNLLQFYRSQNISVNQEIENIDEEIEQMIEYFKNSKDAHDNKIKAIEKKENEARYILEQFEEKNEKIKEYKKEMEDLQLNIDSLNKTYYENLDINGKFLKDKKQEIETLNNNIKSTYDSLVEKELLFKELAQENRRQLAQMEEILTEKNKLTKEIKKITDQVTELKDNFNKEKHEFNTLEQLPEELQLLDLQEDEIKKKLQTLHSDIKEKTQIIAELMSEMDTSNKKLNEVTVSLNSNEKTNKQLKENISAKESELKNASLAYEKALKEENELKNLENELKQLENEYSLEEQNVLKIDQEIEDLIQKQKLKNEEILKIDETINKLTEDIHKQNSENTELKNSYDHVKNFVERIEDEIIKLREETPNVDIEEMAKELANVEKNIKLFSSQNSLENPHNQEINRLNEKIENLTTSTQQYIERKTDICNRYKTQLEVINVDIAARKQASKECLNSLSDKVKIIMDYSEVLLDYYKTASEKVEGNAGLKFARIGNCIAKRLFCPISQMAEYLGMTHISLNPPTYEAFNHIFSRFKFTCVQSFSKKDISIKEVIDITSCIVSKRTFSDKTMTNPSPSDSFVSSTNTIVTPT